MPRMLRTPLVALLLLALSAAAGCQPAIAPEKFAGSAVSAALLPESLGLGGSAGQLTISTTAEQGGLVAEVGIVDATALKASYLAVSYDPAVWRPVAVEPTDALPGDGPRIELGVLDVPGTVYCGQVLAHPEDAAGFTGSAVLARVRFVQADGAPALRGTSAAPTSQASAPRLTAAAGPPQALVWHHSMQADYDQNGEVNIADLTPIGQNFKAVSGGGPFPYDSVESVVDGDGNGEVNIADITPIGQNFGRITDAYVVYAGQPGAVPASPAAPSTIAPLATVPFASADGVRSQERLRFSFVPETPDSGLVYWVRPAHGEDEGTPSNTVGLDAEANAAPEITSITADPAGVEEEGTSTLTANASDADGDALTYSWSVDIGTIEPEGQSVLYTAPDTPVHTGATATVTLTVDDGAGGSDTDSLQLEVTPHANIPPEIVSIISNPDPVPSGGQADVVGQATDADGDLLTFNWELAPGDPGSIVASVTGTDAVYFAPNDNNVDIEVGIVLTVTDGFGGSDAQTLTITVAEPVPDSISHVELHASELANVTAGSGTQADPYIIAAGQSVRLVARSMQGFDWSAVGGVEWHDSNPGPGTEIDEEVDERWLRTNGFDSSSVSVWVSVGDFETPRLYFDMVAGGPGG